METFGSHRMGNYLLGCNGTGGIDSHIVKQKLGLDSGNIDLICRRHCQRFAQNEVAQVIKMD